MEQRGVKRKRRTTDNPDDVPSRLRAKLHHGLKEVKKATKKVKAFEAQRLVKRLKDARKGGDESNVRSLEAQLECLKHINLDQIAVKALRSKIKKDALLSKNKDCQEAVSLKLAHAQKELVDGSSTRGLVESRMLSSRNLSTGVSDVIEMLKHVVGGETPWTGDESDASDARGSKPITANMKAPPHKRNDLEEERRRVVVSNEKESGEEDNDDAEDAEPSSSHSSVSDDDGDSVVSEKVEPKGKERQSTYGGESTFLPSLSVGFVSGASDSEWSDAESKIADLPVKKNRRGQRARKAIWQKKFGKNANHLRKQREIDVTARQAVRARAVVRSPESHAVTPRLRSHNAQRNNSLGDLPSNVLPRTHSHADDSRPLHPSWEAKRRLKQKDSPAILPSTGTRIKFT